jgi:glycine hydroxymethyltransferase
MNYQQLKKQDPRVWKIIRGEIERQRDELELIASENYVSAAVLEAMATVLTNKYAEGYPGKRYYGGNQIIDKMEQLAIERAKKLFGAEHVNVQPLSGSPANAAVYMAFLRPGDKVLGLRLDHGGHLSHGHPVNFSGQLYNFIQYELDARTGRLDMRQIEKMALKYKPKMIVAGYSAYAREIEWKKFRRIADKVGAYLMADISHTAGLVAAGELSNPVPLCDVVMTTTHKTLRGPRGAIIMCKEKYAARVDRAVFPGMQGGPHEHIIAAKAVALGEALRPSFKRYARQVVKNAQALSQNLLGTGYQIVSGGTDTHLMVVDLSRQNLSGRQAEKILDKAGISVSRSTVPNDPRPPYNPSGIRLGTAALTTRGMCENEMKLIGELIDRALKNHKRPSTLCKIKAEVKKLCRRFPPPK